MLDDLKHIYEESASLIPKWKSVGRSELCRRYLAAKASGSDLTESYLSAIICSFWNLISHNYFSQQNPMATPEDCYGWVVDSILYCLDKKVWEDENSPLYKDPNGPEKSINVCVTSSRANYYVAQNRQKRFIALQTISLDYLQELYPEVLDEAVFDKVDAHKDFIYNKIRNLFIDREYFKAFFLHQVLYGNFVKQDCTGKYVKLYFDYNACRKSVRIMNAEDGKFFASQYNFDNEKVQKALHYVNNMSYAQMQASQDALLRSLRADSEFVSLLRQE